MRFIAQYPFWYYLLAVLLALLSSYLFYRKDKRLSDFSKRLILILSLLRFIALLIIFMLLLAPLVKANYKRKLEPIVALLIDASSSVISNQDTAEFIDEFNRKIQNLNADLSNDFSVEKYSFGEQFLVSNKAIDFKQQKTNFELAIDGIKTSLHNRNLSAVILFSDGIYNEGANPLYLNYYDAPTYVVPLGDSSIRTDISISSIQNNEIAFLGNQFSIELNLKYIKAQGQKTILSIEKDNKVLFQEGIQIDNQKFQKKKILLNADSKGLHAYTVKLQAIEGEENTLNNSKTFYIDVLDGRQRVLLLYQAPHPDIRAIRDIISRKEDYQVEVAALKDFRGNIQEFDLVIFHQLPNSSSRFNDVWKDIEENQISSLFILGPQTNINAFNSLNLSHSLALKQDQLIEFSGIQNSSFPLFDISDLLFDDYPPLSNKSLKISSRSNHFTALNQKIGSVETNYPLLVFSESNNFKHALFFGTNLWRWRIQDGVNQDASKPFENLLLKSIQFLALKTDKSLFRLSHDKQFEQGKSLIFEAELYNESYEITTKPEIEILISNGNEEFFYNFSKRNNSYFLALNDFPVGNYNYIAKATIAGKNLEEKGSFSVRELKQEQKEMIADYNLLYQIASKTGGQLINYDDLNRIIEELNNKNASSSIVFEEEELKEIIHMDWIFYILLSLLSLEWFIRKRAGAY